MVAAFATQRSRYILLVTALLFSVGLSLVVGSFNAPPAHADVFSCNYTGTATCSTKADTQGRYVITQTAFYSRGNVWLQVISRSFMFTGTGDNERYMLYQMTVTLNPDQNARLGILTSITADTSSSGNNSTFQSRLWSNNDRSCNSSNQPCYQENFIPLEIKNECDATGGSQTFSAGYGTKGGTIGWSDTIPTYSSCLRVPSSDVWSQYYDYTVTDSTLIWTKTSKDFLFSQWEYNNCCNRQVKIGLSAHSELFDPGPKIDLTGPAVGNNYATYTY